jgi:hypothetical protein
VKCKGNFQTVKARKGTGNKSYKKAEERGTKLEVTHTKWGKRNKITDKTNKKGYKK